MPSEQPDEETPEPEKAEPDTSLVRPYVITGGQTQARTADLPVEAVVVTAPGAPLFLLGFERKQITDICTSPTSIAEVANALDLPLGVARYLVSDLTDQGYLDTQGMVTIGETELLEQLIEGIRAL